VKKFSVMHDSPEVSQEGKTEGNKFKSWNFRINPKPADPCYTVFGCRAGGVISVFYVFEVQVALLNYLPESILANISP
jgi:hypothetical protein